MKETKIPTPTKVKGFFKDWEFDRLYAKNGKGIVLWIANGRSFFADDDYNSTLPFLRHIGFLTKWRLFTELKKESKRRSLQYIKSTIE